MTARCYNTAVMVKSYAIGVDLGGTHARWALVRLGGTKKRSVRVVMKSGVSTKKLGNPRAFVSLLAKDVKVFFNRGGISRPEVKGIGIGVPGSVDVNKGVVHFLPNVPNWRNVPLVRWVRRRIPLPVFIENDANAMACGEFFFGAARHARNAVFLTLGTGLGGGLLLNGSLFRGHSFSAAEIGHLRYGGGVRACACGSRGCIETQLGSGYLVREAERDLKRGVPTLLRKILRASGGKKIRLEMLTEAARQGDRYAIRFWKRTGEVLGDFLGGICNLLNPEVVVVGGGISQAGRFLFDPLRLALKRGAFPQAARSAKVVKAAFGADSGLVGAAAVVFAPEGER